MSSSNWNTDAGSMQFCKSSFELVLGNLVLPLSGLASSIFLEGKVAQ